MYYPLWYQNNIPKYNLTVSFSFLRSFSGSLFPISLFPQDRVYIFWDCLVLIYIGIISPLSTLTTPPFKLYANNFELFLSLFFLVYIYIYYVPSLDFHIWLLPRQPFIAPNLEQVPTLWNPFIVSMSPRVVLSSLWWYWLLNYEIYANKSVEFKLYMLEFSGCLTLHNQTIKQFQKELCKLLSII